MRSLSIPLAHKPFIKYCFSAKPHFNFYFKPLRERKTRLLSHSITAKKCTITLDISIMGVTFSLLVMNYSGYTNDYVVIYYEYWRFPWTAVSGCIYSKQQLVLCILSFAVLFWGFIKKDPYTGCLKLYMEGSKVKCSFKFLLILMQWHKGLIFFVWSVTNNWNMAQRFTQYNCSIGIWCKVWHIKIVIKNCSV